MRSSALGLRGDEPSLGAFGFQRFLLLIGLAESAAVLVVLPGAGTLGAVVEFVVGGQQVAVLRDGGEQFGVGADVGDRAVLRAARPCRPAARSTRDVRRRCRSPRAARGATPPRRRPRCARPERTRCRRAPGSSAPPGWRGPAKAVAADHRTGSCPARRCGCPTRTAGRRRTGRRRPRSPAPSVRSSRSPGDRPSRRFSATDMENSVGSSNAVATVSRSAGSDSSRMSWPSMRISPSVTS